MATNDTYELCEYLWGSGYCLETFVGKQNTDGIIHLTTAANLDLAVFY